MTHWELLRQYRDRGSESLLLTGAIVTPIALTKAHAGPAPVTHLTFADNTKIHSSTPGVDVEKVRAEIDSHYGARLGKLSRNDPKGMETFAAPDFTMTYLHGRTVTGDSWARDAAPPVFPLLTTCAAVSEHASDELDRYL